MPHEPTSEAIARIFDSVDPRLASALRLEFERRLASDDGRRARAGEQVVLVGHRAAGKSRLLPIAAHLISRPAVDLDESIARRTGRSTRDLFDRDRDAFRAEERAAFLAVPVGAVIAAGGGFLALHADLLEGHLAVLVPVTFETYRERLLADGSRPRLRPEVSLEDEIASVFRERESAHARAPSVSLVDWLLGVAVPERR
jgi:shikimate kinase